MTGDLISTVQQMMDQTDLPQEIFLDAIQSATYRAAKVNKMDDKIGSIEVGKEADLIIVEGKPDQNIDDLSNVKQVYISGNRLI